jgi:outer membrane receptor protein involved in Fe transport
VTTWKAGLSWAPVADIRFRATRSRDIRAPSLIELFAGPSVLGITTPDPHTVPPVQSLLSSVTIGNPALTPEKGDTTTVGVVLTPSFLRGFSASVDYYDIKIGQAMVTRTLPDVLAGCEASNGTGPDCALISRPLPFSDRTPANAATQVITPIVNASAFRVKGIDFELGYRTDLGGIVKNVPAALQLRLVGSYLITRKSQVNAAAPVFELAGQSGAIDNGGGGLNPISYPKLRMSFLQDLSVGRFSLDLAERFIGAMKQSLTQVVVPSDNRVKPILYTDITLRYKLGAIEPFLSVNNLTNTQPPLIPINRAVPAAFYPTNSLVYDTLGRYFMTGVRLQF